ncbi:MAG: sigma-70 family RNA polymerase sigma factor [Deltaproteobacteria bacterium]
MMRGKLVLLRKVAGQLEELSDESLVAACALGDSAAMGALIDRFQRAVYRFVARLIGSADSDRDDLVQSTFVEVALCAPSFRGRSSVKVWIFGIAANLARNHVRSAARRRRFEGVLAALPETRSSSPARVAEHHELMARLGPAIADLPQHLREAFVMCDLEDVPCREAAKALGVREGTIWRRVHEARKTLRDVIGGQS